MRRLALACAVVLSLVFVCVASAQVPQGTGRSLSVVEGAQFSGTVASFSTAFCSPTSCTATIDWGDGTSSGGTIASTPNGFEVSGTHTWAEDGKFTYVVTLKDPSGATVGTAQGTATVADAPLTASGVSIAATVGEPFAGRVATFTDADPGGVVSDYSASIDWGDGTVTGGTVAAVAGGGFEVTGSHTYSAAGSRNVAVSIHDAGGASAGAASTATVGAGSGSSAVPAIVTGTGQGGGPNARTFDLKGALAQSFFAFDPLFTGGVRVAAGDVNGDGVEDIIAAAGPGGGPQVKVFDGKTLALLMSFFAYDPSFTGGVYVAAADVNGDGRADIVTGTGAGLGPSVKVFSGANGALLKSFLAFNATFMGGVRVAAGDLNGDGRADVIAGAGPGGGPQVKVFDGVTGSVLTSFFAYAAGFTGGVFVAAGDVNGDGRADLVTGPGSGSGPQVKVFDGGTLAVLHSFFAFDPSFTGGVAVSAGDVNGDKRADAIAGAGPGGGPAVRAFDGVGGSQIASFFAYSPSFAQGVFVATGDVLLPAKITRLTVTAKVFRVGLRATPISARAIPAGTKFRFRLAAPAKVAIVIERRTNARRVGQRCVLIRRGSVRTHPCFRRVGTLRRRGKAGTNSVAFSGRIGRRPLSPGTYRAGVGVAGRPAQQYIAFKIVR